jgi:hypothetical protein
VRGVEAVGVRVVGVVETGRRGLDVHPLDEAALVAGHVDRQGLGRVVAAGDQHRLQQHSPGHPVAGFEAGLRLVVGQVERRHDHRPVELAVLQHQPGRHQLHQAGDRAAVVGVEGRQRVTRVPVDHHVGGRGDRREVAGGRHDLDLAARQRVGHRRHGRRHSGRRQQPGPDQAAEGEGLQREGPPGRLEKGSARHGATVRRTRSRAHRPDGRSRPFQSRRSRAGVQPFGR